MVLAHEEGVRCSVVQGAIRYSEGVVRRRELSCRSEGHTAQTWRGSGLGQCRGGETRAKGATLTDVGELRRTKGKANKATWVWGNSGEGATGVTKAGAGKTLSWVTTKEVSRQERLQLLM